VRVHGTTAAITLRCVGASGHCTGRGYVTVRERRRGKRIVGVAPHARGPKRRRITVTLGSHRFTLRVGHSLTVRVSLNRPGRSLLADHARLRVTLHVTATVAKRVQRVKTTTITFKQPKPKHRR
jgi:hypothetical protein